MGVRTMRHTLVFAGFVELTLFEQQTVGAVFIRTLLQHASVEPELEHVLLRRRHQNQRCKRTGTHRRGEARRWGRTAHTLPKVVEWKNLMVTSWSTAAMPVEPVP